MTDLRVAYVSRGELFVSDVDSQPPRAIASRFAADVRDRAGAVQQKHAWKSLGRGAAFQRGMAWGVDMKENVPHPVFMTGVGSGGQDGRLLYSLQSGVVCGVFDYDLNAPEDDAETRLFHTADYRVSDLGGIKDGFLLCTVDGRKGSAIAVMTDEGKELTEITAGDSVDSAPSWVPGKDRIVVFQSRGIGRDAAGHVAGLGPAMVQELDIPEQRITTLLADERFDYLAPRVSADGTVYCLRRPHLRPTDGGSPLQALLDVALFPFRLLFALLQWLNFFTARMTGKPLTTAGGPKRNGPDLRQMMMMGNLAGAQAHEPDEPSAPGNWKLIRRSPDGAVDVLAGGVTAYDLAPEGLVYSDGRAPYHLTGDGQRRRIASAPDVSSLRVLSAP